MPELTNKDIDKNLTWMPHTDAGDPKDRVPAYTKRLIEPIIQGNGPSAAITAISASSENVEKALQLIELINTNDELYCLLAYGEKGIDYNWNADTGNVEYTNDKYSFNWSEWELGQSFSETFTRFLFNSKEPGDIQKKQLKAVYEADKNGNVSPIMGFVFDIEPVKTQIANCSAVTTEMVASLGCGSVDPDQYLPIFLEKLKTAGVDDVIAEKQAQLDAWRKANGN
jgi:putative aldouronate transport system substrate-binding protein